MDFSLGGGSVHRHETVGHRKIGRLTVDFQRVVLGPLRDAHGNLLIQAVRVGHMEGDVAAPGVFVAGLGLFDGEVILELRLVGYELVRIHRLAIVGNRV